MSIAFLSTLGTSDLVNQIGAYNQYGGKGHDAATILQKRYKKYCYRKRVPFGSGIIREDLEQIHGFFRTLVFGPSIENRNMFALRVLRQRRVKTLTSGMLDQLVVYCERIPVDEDDPITTRALNGAFKVKFICEAFGGMPATSWDEKKGRWSSEFETEETLYLLKSLLSTRDEALLSKLASNHGQQLLLQQANRRSRLHYGNWSRTNPIFNQYIRALKCICRQTEYYSKEWETILKDISES
tara:strand:- start:155 stop:877 length:723 start_codon:yes stop_codon:yes gene_type:complete